MKIKCRGSYYDVKKWMKKLGLGYEFIHICKYVCALLWGQHTLRENCLLYGESHWVDKNTKGKKVSHKV